MKKKGIIWGIMIYMSQLKQERRFSSAKSYRDAMRSFMRFCGQDDYPYHELNRDILRRYEAYLTGNGCSRNTISTYMRRLRCIYNLAVEAGQAPYIPNLFHDVFTGVDSKRKKSLTLEEQHKLLTVPVKDKSLRRTQQAACLMFQYGGMAFVDFARLRPENIRKGVLDYKRRKTGTPMCLEVLPTSRAMCEELVCEGDGRYLFPFLCGTKEGYDEYKEYNTALARFNRNLKLLAREAGVESEVTSYTIRHSFAMALKEHGVPIEMISELLGHRSIKTTQIYLRSFSLERQTAVNSACFERVYNYSPKAG